MDTSEGDALPVVSESSSSSESRPARKRKTDDPDESEERKGREVILVDSEPDDKLMSVDRLMDSMRDAESKKIETANTKIVNEVIDALICPLCTEMLVLPYRSTCCHSICGDCLFYAKPQMLVCPLCRGSVPPWHGFTPAADISKVLRCIPSYLPKLQKRLDKMPVLDQLMLSKRHKFADLQIKTFITTTSAASLFFASLTETLLEMLSNFKAVQVDLKSIANSPHNVIFFMSCKGTNGFAIIPAGCSGVSFAFKRLPFQDLITVTAFHSDAMHGTLPPFTHAIANYYAAHFIARV